MASRGRAKARGMPASMAAPNGFAIVARTSGATRVTRREVHLGIGEQTPDVRTVEVTGRHMGGAPVRPDLHGQIPANEEIESVTAKRRGRKRGAAPIETPLPRDLAVLERIPPPEPYRDEDASRDPEVRAARWPGRRLMARDFDPQVAEFQAGITVLEGRTPLETPVAEPVAQVPSGKGGARPAADWRNRGYSVASDMSHY